ncbi:MAG: 2-C-methyl-D-erythritol 4-phosphate cytidylyltransferase [Deltaproteobacteria bacterium]|jgi:2-C-methyl-D-erythritol 4-phosphate cytidylyltransferase/2-C-methyl-D-erythritol 2,4-cyclodiphosphate synthase
MPKAVAIIPAGGIGSRMGLPMPKQFCLLAGIPLLIHTLRAFAESPIDAIIVVAPTEHLEATRTLIDRFGITKVRAVVAGGRLRQDSVAAGLREVPPSTELVAVHDGARPLVTPALIADCLDEARRSGAAMAAIPVKDTLKAVTDDKVLRTVNRDGLWQAQTPQVARIDLLLQAFAASEADGFVGTDEASLLEHIGITVCVIEGSERNLKITRPEDLLMAEALLGNERQEENPMAGMEGGATLRIGHGYDAHCLIAGRPLVLGGVTIPHPKGLLGHSDADVLTHALCDAILGALGEGDIGSHFPDSDERYRGISSLKLLAETMALVSVRGMHLVNVDVTVVAQQPKLAPHFPEMRAKLAGACGIAPEAINLKASTTEKMGFAGREEGIAAHAVALLTTK